MVGSVRSVDLFLEPSTGAFRFRRRDRPGDAAGLQLGTWAVRTLGCGRRGGHSRTDEERGQAGIAERREAARIRAEVVVHGRCEVSGRTQVLGNWNRKLGTSAGSGW